MKQLRSLILIFTVSTLLCCKNDLFAPAENNGLIGKWKLVEVLADPGDGSGKFRKVSKAQSNTIEFKANGDFSETNGIIIPSRAPNDSYVRLDDTRLELKNRANPSTFNQVLHIRAISPKMLVLSPGCIEPCESKYIAIK